MACASSAGVIDRTFRPRELAPVVVPSSKGQIQFDLNKSALVIIDMQVYFLKDAEAPGRELIGRMNQT